MPAEQRCSNCWVHDCLLHGFAAYCTRQTVQCHTGSVSAPVFQMIYCCFGQGQLSCNVMAAMVSHLCSDDHIIMYRHLEVQSGAVSKSIGVP